MGDGYEVKHMEGSYDRIAAKGLNMRKRFMTNSVQFFPSQVSLLWLVASDKAGGGDQTRPETFLRHLMHDDIIETPGCIVQVCTMHSNNKLVSFDKAPH